MKDFNLDAVIRKIKDFPKPGILFYDVTSIFTNPEAFNWILDKAESLYKGKKIEGIMAIESRGFIVASPLANRLNIPLILARKKGKLPGKTIEQSYSLEYGQATLEVHTADIKPGSNILILDDLIATGGTFKACAQMVERLEAKVSGFFAIIGLPFLKYEELLKGYPITTLINYHGE